MDEMRPGAIRKTTPSLWIGVALLSIAGATVGCGKTTTSPEGTDRSSKPPLNVLVLLIDTLRADHLGCYGYSRDTSPHIDRLAGESLFFRTGHAHSPWTKPSIPTLFTSLYPIQHRVYEGERPGPDGFLADILAEECVTLAESLHEAGYRTAAFAHNAHLAASQGMSQGFEVYEQENMKAREIHSRFLEFLDREDDRPFFAYLHYLDVHWPYLPEPPFDVKFPSPSGHRKMSKDDWRAVRNDVNDGLIELSEVDRQFLIAQYDGGIAEVDAEIGKLLAELERRGRLEDTVILLTSDHGEEILDHGRLGHGGSLFEELLRIPFMIRLPGEQPRVAAGPARLVDVFPTLAKLVGAGTPPHCEGQDLLDPTTAIPELVAETRHKRSYKVSFLEDGWKYVRHYKTSLPLPGFADADPTLLFSMHAGMRVKARFRRDSEGRFLATRVSLKDPSDDDVEVTAPLTEVGADGLRLTLSGITGHLEKGARVEGFEDLTSVSPGTWLKVEGDLHPEGWLEIDKVEPVPVDDRTLEIEGLIARVEGTDRDEGWIQLGGKRVRVTEDTRLKGFPEEPPSPGQGVQTAEEDPFSPDRLLAGEALSFEEQLYSLSEDPGEVRSVAARHPERIEGFRRRLASWLRRVQATRHDQPVATERLDEATIEQLRELGYLR